jgi:hypothetical protein
MYTGVDKKMMHKKSHYSNLPYTPQNATVICRFVGRKGYYHLSDIIRSPFNGEVEVFDTRIGREKIGVFRYPELRKKYI